MTGGAAPDPLRNDSIGSVAAPSATAPGPSRPSSIEVAAKGWRMRMLPGRLADLRQQPAAEQQPGPAAENDPFRIEQVDQVADPDAQVLCRLLQDGGRSGDVAAASISSASASSWSSAAIGRPYRSRIASAPA